MSTPRRIQTAGFTLAELIVATTLLSIVMLAVYGAFSGTMAAWRSGEEDMDGFRDVRLAMDVMRREMQSIIPGSQYLFEGGRDSLEFYVSAPPLFLGDGSGTRQLRVRYHTERDRDRGGLMLVRSEAPVQSPLPPPPPPPDEADAGRTQVTAVDLGREEQFYLVRDVEAVTLEYYWMRPPEPRPVEMPPVPVEPIIKNSVQRELGLPQGVRMQITVADPRSDAGTVTFTQLVRFYGQTTPVTEELLLRLGVQ